MIDQLRTLRAAGAVAKPDTYELKDEVLTTGDYVVQAGAHVLIIERKTWADLAASIKDGRIFANHKKMLDGAAAGFRIAYLIEGRAPSPDISATKVDGIPIRTMMDKLDHFAFRDHVILEFTRDAAHTAARLLELGRHMATLPQPDGGGEQSPDVDAVVKKKHIRTIAEVQEAMLACVPGIGEKSASVLLAAAPFADLVAGRNLPEWAMSKTAMSELTELAAGRRETVLVAMLKQIKGVSPSMATQIAAVYHNRPDGARLPAAADGPMLADLKLAGRRLGPALAAVIVAHWGGAHAAQS